jgi:hypothetical protein
MTAQIDWLVDVALKFKLRTETMFLAVNFLDRFLERQITAKNRLQLVRRAALCCGVGVGWVLLGFAPHFICCSHLAVCNAMQCNAMQCIVCV